MKDQGASIFGFVSHLVLVTTAPFYCSMKVGTYFVLDEQV